jgi:hypothetical protein
MDWARILAYVTGTMDQELLARNEYLATECPVGLKLPAASPARSRQRLRSSSTVGQKR